MTTDEARTHPVRPYLLPSGDPWPPNGEPKVSSLRSPISGATLGDLGVAARVTGPRELPESTLVLPFERQALTGIDQATVRIFRADRRGVEAVWNSGVNAVLGFAWARISRPGTYVAIGLPRDRVLQAVLLELAYRRRYADSHSPQVMLELTLQAFRELLDMPVEQLERLRDLVTRVEADTGVSQASPDELRFGRGAHLQPFPLPGDMTLEELRERLASLEPPGGVLPEEALLDPPELLQERGVPWPVRPGTRPPDRWLDPRDLALLDAHAYRWFERYWPWFFSWDWWMYQHDERHSGHASGWSNLRQTSVHRLYQRPRISVDGDIFSKPSVVDGKIYVGSGRQPMNTGGTLYKIDLYSGTVEGRFEAGGSAFYPWKGIGGSPAIVANRIYFTSLAGRVYCIDADTMTPTPPHPGPIWMTDLRTPDAAKRQPVNQPNADCWSGPLVVNGRVYIGCGEGESASTYGFVFCLDAEDGHVVWCFCTSKFRNRRSPGMDNQPNVIPSSVAVSDPLPGWAVSAGFSIHPDPPGDRSTGCSVWSSCAYDSVLDRVYVGTGNSMYEGGGGGTTAPDKLYGSGCISLDASTGAFRGFFSPATEDSYWPGDSDIDVPGSPTIFSHGGVRALAFGSKSGAFFLLDPDTMAPLARRQLLPRHNGSGVPGDRGDPVPLVVPTGGLSENAYGIFGTPALHRGLGVLYVGLGGYHGLTLDVGIGLNPTSTPFMRAVRWTDLSDYWPTVVGADGISRYVGVSPPMYRTREVGLSSPAVVNDVVFVSTGNSPYTTPSTKSGFYALAANTGLCLWSAPGIPENVFILGPAVYGDYVVLGAGSNVYIYTLRSWFPPWWVVHYVPWWERYRTWPPPPPPPDGVRAGAPVVEAR